MGARPPALSGSGHYSPALHPTSQEDTSAMSGFKSRLLASVLAVAAVAVTGCGSSSKSKTSAATAPTAATPTVQSTASTPTSTTPKKLPASTPITSPAFIAVLKQSEIRAGVSTSKEPAVTQCVIQKLQAKGIKTGGEFLAQRSTSVSIVDNCVLQVGK